MTGKTQTRISASRLRDFLLCPHRVYLDEFGDDSLRDPESEFEKLLWEQGMLHEERALAELNLSVAEIRGKDFNECERETRGLMLGGEELIYQGCLSTDSLAGKPDLLEKTDGESNLGPYHYVPIEMKSGSAYADEESKRLKQDYVLQLSLYADMLEKVQGARPKIGKIIDKDFEVVTVELEEFRAAYDECLEDIQGLLSGKTTSDPCIASLCKQCHWWTVCFNWAREREDVSLIYRVNRPKRDALRRNGVETIKELAALEKKSALPVVEGISPRALRQFIRRASVVLKGKPVLHSPVEFPKANLELFFDIETDPLEDVCYLYGIVERTASGSRYVSFFADSLEGEKKAWNEFWEYVSGLADFQVYHYSAYEKTFLRRLNERYGCDKKLFESFLERCIDLFYGAVDRCTDWPSHSYSIKLVSKCLGFKYSEAEPGGIKAALWYRDYLKDPKGNLALKDEIIKYNREDCEAMILLKDWLERTNQEIFGTKQK